MAALESRRGDRITVTAPTGGLTGGDLYAVREGTSGRGGVVLQDTDAGDSAVIIVEGAYEVAKNTGTGESFAVGAAVYIDDSTGDATASATGNHLCGYAIEAATTSATKVWVKLNG